MLNTSPVDTPLYICFSAEVACSDYRQSPVDCPCALQRFSSSSRGTAALLMATALTFAFSGLLGAYCIRRSITYCLWSLQLSLKRHDHSYFITLLSQIWHSRYDYVIHCSPDGTLSEIGSCQESEMVNQLHVNLQYRIDPSQALRFTRHQITPPSCEGEIMSRLYRCPAS